MPGNTPELNLKTALDSDDNADYLTLSLADSLRTLDALFSATTGHSHDGSAHQGGIISSDTLEPPIDLGGVFRSTGSIGLPNAGIGLEMYYDSGQDLAVLQSYNRNATLYKPLGLLGSDIRLSTGGTVRMTIQADGHTRLGVGSGLIFNSATGTSMISAYGKDPANTEILMMSGLTVTPGMTYLAGVTVNGNASITGTLSIGGAVSTPSLALTGALTVGTDLTVTRNVGIGGTLTVNGGIGVGSVTSNANIVATTSLQTNSGNVFFEGSQQVRITWAPASTRLEVPYGNGLWASGLASGGTIIGQDVYGNRLRCVGTNTNLGAVSGECIAFLNVTPGSMIAQVAINEANGHSKILWVNGAAGGTTGWQQESTRTSKSDIVPLDSATAVAMVTSSDIQAYRYLHRDDIPEVGFLAEEWVDPLPEAVTYDDGALNGLTYGMITPVLYAALKDALARISALEAK